MQSYGWVSKSELSEVWNQGSEIQIPDHHEVSVIKDEKEKQN